MEEGFTNMQMVTSSTGSGKMTRSYMDTTDFTKDGSSKGVLKEIR